MLHTIMVQNVASGSVVGGGAAAACLHCLSQMKPCMRWIGGFTKETHGQLVCAPLDALDDSRSNAAPAHATARHALPAWYAGACPKWYIKCEGDTVPELQEQLCPMLKLRGKEVVVLKEGDEYTDEGAFAHDPIFGDVSNRVTTQGDTVTTASAYSTLGSCKQILERSNADGRGAPASGR